MDKLKQLLDRCECGVYLNVNTHRDVYETAEQKIAQAMSMECPPEIAPEVRAEMERTNTVIELQFYPDTPIGFYTVWHHDLDAALDEALACLAPTTSGGEK